MRQEKKQLLSCIAGIRTFRVTLVASKSLNGAFSAIAAGLAANGISPSRVSARLISDPAHQLADATEFKVPEAVRTHFLAHNGSMS
jgi:hypothetical protein